MAKKAFREKPEAAAPENTKEALLEAGKHLFASQGFAGTTVKDISEKAGVNISLVSYHFQGKEGLYRSCLEHYGKGRLEAAERMLQFAESQEEFRIRITMFIDELMNWMLNEPEIHMIIQRECDSGLPIAEDVFRATYLKIIETLFNFVANGQKKKYVRSDLDPVVVTQIFFGGITNMIRSDHMAKRFHGTSMHDPSFRKKVKDQGIILFLDGILNRKDK